MALMEGLGLGMDPYTTRSKAALTIMNQNLMEAVSGSGCCLFPLFSFYPGWLISHPKHMITKAVNAILPYSSGVVNFMNKYPGKMQPIHMPALPHTHALSAVTGMKVTVGVLKEMGERGFNVERLFNLRMGMTGADDALPGRLTDEPQVENDPRTRVPLAEMKKEYYKIRGWSPEGVPGYERKRQLGIRE
jgi:aldehyde:ferredoxin oxidoreductase